MRIALFLLWLLHWLPLWLISALAWIPACLLFIFGHERRRVGLINLRLCFPEQNKYARTLLLFRNVHAMTRMVLEYGIMWHASEKRLKKLIKITHLDYLTQYKNENVIILYSHFVGFEMCVYRLNMEVGILGLYSQQKNAEFDRAIYEGRQRFNNAKIISRQESLRTILRAMNDHTPFLYLPDQDLGARDSIFVPFFGIQTATITGLSRIAKLAKARVVPAVARRKGHQYELEFFPAWEHFPSEDIKQDCTRMNQFIEARILEQPEQYFWLHKRFKTRPEGQARFYK